MFGPAAAVLDPKAVPGFYVVDNLRAIQPADLEDKKMFTKIAMFVRDLDDEGAGFRAKETFEILLSLLDQNENLFQIDPELFRNYFNLLVILKGNFLGLLEVKGVEEFLREQALIAITIPLFPFRELDFLFNLKDKIAGFIQFDVWYLDEVDKNDILQSLIFAVEKNEEYLGEDSLKIEGKPLLEPIMANWLLDYNQSAHASFGKRSSFDRAKYLNASLLVRTLGSSQKVILQNFLEFYDWLKFEAKNLIHSKAQVKINELVLAENRKLKAPQFSGAEKPGFASRPSNTNFVNQRIGPAEDIQKINKTIEERSQSAPKMSAPPPLAPQAAERKLQPPPGLAFRPQKPGQPQTAPPNRTPDISQIRKEIEEKRNLAQRQIDKKLQDLKNRKTPAR